MTEVPAATPVTATLTDEVPPAIVTEADIYITNPPATLRVAVSTDAESIAAVLLASQAAF